LRESSQESYDHEHIPKKVFLTVVYVEATQQLVDVVVKVERTVHGKPVSFIWAAVIPEVVTPRVVKAGKHIPTHLSPQTHGYQSLRPYWVIIFSWKSFQHCMI